MSLPMTGYREYSRDPMTKENGPMSSGLTDPDEISRLHNSAREAVREAMDALNIRPDALIASPESYAPQRGVEPNAQPRLPSAGWSWSIGAMARWSGETPTSGPLRSPRAAASTT